MLTGKSMAAKYTTPVARGINTTGVLGISQLEQHETLIDYVKNAVQSHITRSLDDPSMVAFEFMKSDGSWYHIWA